MRAAGWSRGIGADRRAGRPSARGQDLAHYQECSSNNLSADTRHAEFIDAVVGALADRDAEIELEQALEIAAENGWADMAHAVRCILDGRRDAGIYDSLGADDRAIVEAILARVDQVRS